MRIGSTSSSIYRALKALPWRTSYLSAMWILCSELQSLYADWINDNEVLLISATLDLVREVVITGESAQVAVSASELAADWRRVKAARKAEASAGLRNAWATFEALAQEIAGITIRYDAADWVTNAAEDRWRDSNNPRPILVNPNEEIDDSSQMAQTLALFNRIVSEVKATEGPEWDPLLVRERIFGGR